MKLKGKSREQYEKLLKRAGKKKRGYILNILRHRIDIHTYYYNTKR